MTTLQQVSRKIPKAPSSFFFFTKQGSVTRDRPVKINVCQNILHQTSIILATQNNDSIVNLAEPVLLQILKTKNPHKRQNTDNSRGAHKKIWQHREMQHFVLNINISYCDTRWRLKTVGMKSLWQGIVPNTSTNNSFCWQGIRIEYTHK